VAAEGDELEGEVELRRRSVATEESGSSNLEANVLLNLQIENDQG
jgi:hypothetical protein